MSNDPNIPSEPEIEVESSGYDAIFKQFTDNYVQTSALQRFITVDPVCIALKTKAMQIAYAPDVADVILITGQSGSGKELFAQAMHKPHSGPFVPVNMAGLPDTLAASLLFGHRKGTFTGANEDRQGIFEAAGTGTVFLDEIGDMPLTQQALLLRVLQEKEVTPLGDTTPIPIQCRIVAATNKNLQREADLRSFRDDLLARLSMFTLAIPDFSKRLDDIPVIAEHYKLPTQQAQELVNPQHLDRIFRYGVRAIQGYAKRWKLFRTLA